MNKKKFVFNVIYKNNDCSIHDTTEFMENYVFNNIYSIIFLGTDIIMTFNGTILLDREKFSKLVQILRLKEFEIWKHPDITIIRDGKFDEIIINILYEDKIYQIKLKQS